MESRSDGSAQAPPPGPQWPRVVQTAWWALRPMSLLESCGERYGDVFTIRTFGLGDVVFVADPLAVKEVFTGGGRAATPACPHATRAAQPAR